MVQRPTHNPSSLTISDKPSAMTGSLIGEHFLGLPARAPQRDAALRRADEVEEVLHFGAGERAIELNLLQRGGRVQLGLQEIAERALQLLDHLGLDMAPLQADDVRAEHTRRAAAD